MKNTLFLICALALLTVGFAAAAYAGVPGEGQQLEGSADQDNTDNGNLATSLCDMHGHSHIAPADFAQISFPKAASELLVVLSESTTSSFLYGLKRPPRI